MLLAVLAAESFSDLVDVSLAAIVSMSCERDRVVVAGQDIANDAHAGLTSDVGDDVVEFPCRGECEQR